MKKSRIFMAAGGFVLAIAGVLATKANRKFLQVTTAETHAAFLGQAADLQFKVSDISSHFTNTFNALAGTKTCYLALITVNMTSLARVTLITTAGGTSPDKVYYY
jgi:hypothetical protein